MSAKPLKKSAARKRILIVDDHAVLREGLMTQINREPDLEVCGEAINVTEALVAVEKLNPDLLLADINLPGRNGLELIRDVRVLRPDLPTLVLSMHDEEVFAERVLRAGGRGYVSKHQSGHALIAAIRHVLGGQIYLSDRVSTRLLDRLSGAGNLQRLRTLSPVDLLTDRELEVFHLVGKGFNTREIAEQIHLGETTLDEMCQGVLVFVSQTGIRE